MRPVFPIFLALTTALAAAEDAKQPQKLPAASLLPDGSELKGVMIPRHDENHHLVGSLKAELVTLVNNQMIAGRNVVIDFFHDDGSSRGQIKLDQASVDQFKGMLKSSQPVTIDSETFHARGKGIHYAFQKGEGFLTGPATTWIKALTETTMNSKSSSLIGATGLALISQSVALTSTQAAQEEKKPVMINTVQAASPKEAQALALEQLAQDQKAREAADMNAEAFLSQTSLNTEELLNSSSIPTHTQPLDVKTGAKDIVISCDGGMYFNADKGLLVYLKNVTVNDSRFSLTGANELKIFLSQKSKPDAAKAPKDDASSVVSKFDQVERIIATGAVRLLQRSVEEGKAPVEASGAIFTYRPATGEILLSGGYPWVKQGSSFMRAKEPNLTLRIQKSGSFVTEGNWEMGGTLNSN